MQNQPYKPYMELERPAEGHPVLEEEVVLQAYVSYLLPTLRLGTAAYVAFAAPRAIRPNEPTLQSPPSAWWGFDARTGVLLLYARTAVHSPGELAWPEAVTLPPTALDPEQATRLIERIEGLIGDTATDFFEQQPGRGAFRRSLLEALGRAVPEPLYSVYEVLAPDYFQWLRQPG